MICKAAHDRASGWLRSASRDQTPA
jgi:hypothetical protein